METEIQDVSRCFSPSGYVTFGKKPLCDTVNCCWSDIIFDKYLVLVAARDSCNLKTELEKAR